MGLNPTDFHKVEAEKITDFVVFLAFCIDENAVLESFEMNLCVQLFLKAKFKNSNYLGAA